jgi:tRNA-dihydrouridine synthase A
MALRDCARMAEDWGYDGINLNVGCPSERVQNGSFGACLMATPELVAECVASMQAATSLPVTVKHRIGIDAHDSYEFMFQFVDTVSKAGCKQFIVHARIALLSGLNPKQNLKVPPLRYDDVYRLKKDFPELNIHINGGIQDLTQAKAQLEFVDGTMIGRAACDDPFMFAQADALFFGDSAAPNTREEIVSAMIPYIQAQGEFGRRVTRHMINLYAGENNAKKWRRQLSGSEPAFQ